MELKLNNNVNFIITKTQLRKYIYDTPIRISSTILLSSSIAVNLLSRFRFDKWLISSHVI